MGSDFNASAILRAAAMILDSPCRGFWPNSSQTFWANCSTGFRGWLTPRKTEKTFKGSKTG